MYCQSRPIAVVSSTCLLSCAFAVFEVSESNGDKVKDPVKLASIQQVLSQASICVTYLQEPFCSCIFCALRSTHVTPRRRCSTSTSDRKPSLAEVSPGNQLQSVRAFAQASEPILSHVVIRLCLKLCSCAVDEADEYYTAETTVFELAGADKAGLLAEVTELLDQNDCHVRSAAVSSSKPPLQNGQKKHDG